MMESVRLASSSRGDTSPWQLSEHDPILSSEMEALAVLPNTEMKNARASVRLNIGEMKLR